MVLRMEEGMDKELDELIEKYGVDDILAALCRRVHKMDGRTARTLFGYLNRTYEWYLTKIPPRDAA